MTITIGTPSGLGIDSALVADFYRDEWPSPTALSDYKFYDWQFKGGPTHKGVDNCCIAIDDAGDLVAALGISPRTFYLENASVSAAECTSWMVKEEYKGSGLAPQMIGFLQENYDLILAMGISADALPIYMRMGFRYLRAIPRYVKVLDWKAIKGTADFGRMARGIDQYWSKQEAETSYEVLPYSEGHSEAIFESFKTKNNMFAREPGFLKWRYLNHPVFQYDVKIVKAPQNSDGGAVVCLREDVNDDGMKIMHIVDVYGSSTDVEAALEYAVNRAREAGAAFIDFFGTNSWAASYFLSMGWFSITDDKCFNIPHLHHPTDLRDPATTSLIYWSKENFRNLCDLGKLYVTKQDADFDRPTLHGGAF